MLDLPALQLQLANAIQDHILDLLKRRFQPLPEDVLVTVRQVVERRKLKDLHNLAVACESLDALRAGLRQGLLLYLGAQLTALDEEQGFQKSLKSDPDETTALVYADWLEDKGESSASEFIRVLIGLGRGISEVSGRQATLERLRRLRAGLSPTWSARVVNRLSGRPMKFRVLESVVLAGHETWTVFRGTLESGRLRRGDALAVMVGHGTTLRKYASRLSHDKQDYQHLSAGQEPLEFDLAVRGRLNGQVAGTLVRMAEVDEGLEEKLNRSLDSLGFSVRCLNCLKSEGCRTVRNLTSLLDYELLETRGFGETTLREAREKLAELGLEFGNSAGMAGR
jgi:uncharacterized protein (TIGR02996 family)